MFCHRSQHISGGISRFSEMHPTPSGPASVASYDSFAVVAGTNSKNVGENQGLSTLSCLCCSGRTLVDIEAEVVLSLPFEASPHTHR